MRKVVLGLASLIMTALLAGSAYSCGMFFDELFYRWEWLLCLAGMGAAIAVGVGRKTGSWPEEWNGSGAMLGLLAVALLYGLELLRQPVSMLGSLQQTLRWCAYAAFILLTWLGFGSPGRRLWLGVALQASGFAVAGCALGGWLGGLSFPSMLMMTGDVRLSAVGARLGGFLQYPNFLGAVACAYLVWSLGLLIRVRTAAGAALASAALVPYALVSLLSESRGAWLAAALAWGAGCILYRGKERAAWLLYSGWTLVCGSAACRFILAAGLRGPANGSAGRATAAETLLLLGVCALAPVGFLGLRVLLRAAGNRTCAWVSGMGWLSCAAGMLLLLPPAVYGRLSDGSGVSGGSGTAGARVLFYHDAWRLIRESPLLGRGGDAWRHLFTAVQAQPYVGNEVHSGYAELVLDLGVVGLLVCSLVMVVLLRPVWQRGRVGLLPIGVLLLHALIDFDMSYGYYWLLLLAWMVYSSIDDAGATRYGDGPAGAKLARHGGGPAGVGGARYGDAPTETGAARYEGASAEAGAARYESAPAGAGGAQVSGELPRARHVRAAMMGAAAVCFGTAALLGWRFDAAVRHREAAAAVSGAARTAALRAALEANPYWTRIRLELAEHAPPQDRAALLAAGLRYEPQSVPLLWALGRQYAARADVRGAAACMRRALALDRFDRDKQTEAVVTMARLAEAMRAASRLEEAKLAADQSQAFFAGFAALDRHYPANDRKFALTAAAKAAAVQARPLTARP